METIKTKDFVLRHLKLSDAKPYLETMLDTETRKGLSTPPNSLKEAKESIRDSLKEDKEKGSRHFTIEVKGKYAGNVILQYQNWDKESGEGRVHIWLHPRYRGKGLATKALGTVIKFAFKNNFKKVFAQCKTSNKAVMNVNKKLGFKKVKTFTTDTGVKKTLLEIKPTTSKL